MSNLIASSPTRVHSFSDITTHKTHHNGKDQRGISSPILSSCLLIARQKLNALRVEADTAVTRAEQAEAKIKEYEQQLLEKDQNITSLNHKISLLDNELEKAEAKLVEAKSAQADGEHSKTTNEGLTRKIVLLEEELDAAEKNVKETTEKCVVPNTCHLEICY